MSTKFSNNATSKLASGVAIGAVSMTVTAGQGDRFPVVVAPDVAYVTIENATYTEIIKITARALGADAMTIVKAQEGTTDRAWLTGDTVSLRLTAAQAELGANAQDVAATALAAHEVAADPHPVYTTATELNAAIAAAASSYQPRDAQLDTLAAITAQQATDLSSLSAFIGSLMNDADQATALSTLGALLSGTIGLAAATPVVAAHRGKVLNCSGTWVLAIDAIATLGAGFAFAVLNSGSGTITINPNLSETIDGVATVDLAPGQSCLVTTDAAAAGWITIGRTVSANGSFRSVQTFTASGTYTPPAGLVRAKVTVIGGGGGGQSGNASPSGGSGGGGGGMSIGLFTALQIGASQSVTVGGGGGGGAATAATASNNGGAGGTSSFGTLASATGGAGGTGGTSSGGIGSGGYANISGAPADRPVAGGQGMNGGSSPLGGGGAATETSTGSVGGSYGGGGAGGGGATTGTAGGNGSPGIVIIEEFF